MSQVQDCHGSDSCYQDSRPSRRHVLDLSQRRSSGKDLTSKVESPRSKVAGRRSNVESRKSKVKSPRSKVASRKSKVESPRSKVQGRKSKVEVESHSVLRNAKE